MARTARTTTAPPEPMDPAFRNVFTVLFLVSLSSSSGTTAMQSLLPAIGRSAGIADNLVVTISSLSAFLAIVATPFWAIQSDRFGRKPIVLIGIAGVAVSMVATGLSVLAGVHTLFAPSVILISLVASRGIYGLVGLASMPAIQSYVGVNTSREERTNAIALLASAQGIGTIIGPAVAPFLILPVVSLGGPFFVFALISVVTFVLVVTKMPKEAKAPAAAAQADQPKRLAVLLDPEILPFAIYGVVVSVVGASNIQSLGFVIMDRLRLEPIAAQPFAGIAMMAGAMAVLIAQWGLIRMLRLTPRSLILWGAIIAAAGNLLQAFAPNYAMIVTAFALVNLGFGFSRPGFTAGASLAASPERQSMVAGSISSVYAVGLIVGPITAMTLYQWRREAPFLLNVVMLAALVAYYYASPVLRNASPTQPVSEEAVERSNAGEG